MISRSDRDITLEALNYLDPSDYDNQGWVEIGMALKADGFTVDVWDDWSKKDRRPGEYKPGECEKRWKSFKSSGVTGATIIHQARDKGWNSRPMPVALDDDAVIEDTQIPNVNPNVNVNKLEPYEQLIKYFETLFAPDEYVSYCVNYVVDDSGKYRPCNQVYSFMAKELISDVRQCRRVEELNSYDEKAGAWISFNPFDGKGCKSDNVTRWDHALVECDDMPLEEQYAAYNRLNLPIAALVSSGGRSLHAIVKVNAKNAEEYEARVKWLYDYIESQGVKVDRQCKNPSRLSRMPGFMRNGKLQELIATNIGAASWESWESSIKTKGETEVSILPPFSDYRDDIENPEELKPEVINGLLRQGGKMMIAGNSKIGKTWSMLQLAHAVATGGTWLGRECQQGKVLYINFEVTKAERQDRTRRVREALLRNGIRDDGCDENYKAWDLRGQAKPLEELEKEIIIRCRSQGFVMIIFDPIYKLNGGDENSAADVTRFCNAMERIAVATGAAIVYAHHHSKGAQFKSTMEQFSGSGVFLRDPDAIINFSELAITNEIHVPEFMLNDEFGNKPYAFRLNFSVRSFRTPEPENVWYFFPLHYMDTEGNLDRAKLASDPQANLEASGRRANAPSLEQKTEYVREAIKALESVSILTSTGNIASTIAGKIGTNLNTVKSWLQKDDLRNRFYHCTKDSSWHTDVNE